MKHGTQTWVLATITALSLLGVSLGGCTKKEDDGNLLVYRAQLKDDVKSLDPANAYDVVSLDVAPSIYETLYQYAYLTDTYRITPLLAADLPQVSKDHLTYTIPLKHGVKFQDDDCFEGKKGRELKAQDFIYAWKRLAQPSLDSQGWWIFDGKVDGINAFHDKLMNTPRDQRDPKGKFATAFAEPIEGLKALDDYTLQIKLVKPYPQLMYVLAMTFTAPVPTEAIAKYGDEKGNLTDHPVGTGPYLLKKWDRARQLTLDRNPTYHADFYPTEGSLDFRKKGFLADAGKPLPFLDRLTFDITREAQPRWLSFLSGARDAVDIPKDNFAQAIVNQVNLRPELAAKGLRLHIETGVTFRYIGFNAQDKILKNKYLRQALSSAINREKWIETFTNGTAKKMTTALPPGIEDRPAKSQLKFDFDLAEAKKLLEKAGYPNGEGLPTLTFDLRGADSLSRQQGDFFQSQWAALGVKINVIPNTFPAFLEKMKQGQVQTYYGGWTMDYPDGENVFQLLYGPNKAPGPNDSGYQNPEYDKLYAEMSVLEPGARRAALIRKMDDLIQEDCPWAYGYYEASYLLTQPWIQNFRGNEMISNRYKYLRLNRDVKNRYLHP